MTLEDGFIGCLVQSTIELSWETRLKIGYIDGLTLNSKEEYCFIVKFPCLPNEKDNEKLSYDDRGFPIKYQEGEVLIKRQVFHPANLEKISK